MTIDIDRLKSLINDSIYTNEKVLCRWSIPCSTKDYYTGYVEALKNVLNTIEKYND